jgi:hypothetical protein
LLPVAENSVAFADGLPGIGEAVVSACLFVRVVRLDGKGQRVGVLDAGLVGVAGGEQRFAEAIARLGLSRRIAGLAVQGQGSPEKAGRRPAVPLPQLSQAKASQRLRLTEPDAVLAAYREGLPEIPGGRRVAASP